MTGGPQFSSTAKQVRMSASVPPFFFFKKKYARIWYLRRRDLWYARTEYLIAGVPIVTLPASKRHIHPHNPHMATWVNNKLVLRPLSCSPLFWSYGYAVANALHDYIYIRGNETSDRDRTITTKSTTTTTVGFVLSNYWKYAVTGEIFCYVS